MKKPSTTLINHSRLYTIKDIFLGRGWSAGVSRSGGARAHMCDDLVAQGYLSGPPYEVTPKGVDLLRQRFSVEQLVTEKKIVDG